VVGIWEKGFSKVFFEGFYFYDSELCTHTQSEIMLVDLFKQLVLIQGTSLKEHKVAAFVREYLAGLPFDIIEDTAGQKLGGSTGNLIVVPRHVDRSKPVDVFMAHMDTVRDTSVIKVIETDGRLHSDGTSQLGADNRAGMSIVLDMLSEWEQWEKRDKNYIAVFSIAEEIGLLGAGKLNLEGFDVRAVWVFDSAKRPGAYIKECVGSYDFTATFKGKAAHSAVNPEAGISAIKVAADAVSKFQIGRLAEMTTVNIGTIHGGLATNVVAPECVLHGEIRAVDDVEIQRLLSQTEALFRQVSDSYGATLIFESIRDFGPYQHADDSPMVQRIEAALTEAGLEVKPLRYTGGSDANVLNARGYPSINIGIGAQNPHADDEFILIEDLHSSSRVIRNLICQS
jgi:tripeptide aminopeptidase